MAPFLESNRSSHNWLIRWRCCLERVYKKAPWFALGVFASCWARTQTLAKFYVKPPRPLHVRQVIYKRSWSCLQCYTARLLIKGLKSCCGTLMRTCSHARPDGWSIAAGRGAFTSLSIVQRQNTQSGDARRVQLAWSSCLRRFPEIALVDTFFFPFRNDEVPNFKSYSCSFTVQRLKFQLEVRHHF